LDVEGLYSAKNISTMLQRRSPETLQHPALNQSSWFIQKQGCCTSPLDPTRHTTAAHQEQKSATSMASEINPLCLTAYRKGHFSPSSRRAV